jgi:hypothetical protein
MSIDDPHNNIDPAVRADLPRANRRGEPAHWTPARAAAWVDGTNCNPFLNYDKSDSELRDYWIMGHLA